MVENNGPGLDLKGVEARQGRKIDVSDLGTRIGLQQARTGGCHAPGRYNFTSYYDQAAGVKLPPNVNENCTDNIAMAEFPGNIRFAYVFREWR